MHFSLKIWHLVATILITVMRINWPNLTKIAPIIQWIPCALVQNIYPWKSRGTKHRVSAPLQKFGECPLSTHGTMPMQIAICSSALRCPPVLECAICSWRSPDSSICHNQASRLFQKMPLVSRVDEDMNRLESLRTQQSILPTSIVVSCTEWAKKVTPYWPINKS